MNSDLDNNSDALDSRFLAWLLETESETQSQGLETETSLASRVSGLSPEQREDWSIDELDLLDSEELEFLPSSLGESAPVNHPNLGEIPTVQNRFQALLKRRLQIEIESRPPLFPWETEITDYEPESSDCIENSWISQINLWMPQISDLSLPVPLPEKVLGQLLTACSEAMQFPLQSGAKMLRAVKTLFPDEQGTLNDLANWALIYSFRSPPEEQLLTSRYESATSDQQMRLSLLAAKKIIEALTLPLSHAQPLIERQWQTAAGQVHIQAEYLLGQMPKLRVQSRLPRGGSLTLQTAQGSATAQRNYPGFLSVESFDLQSNQTYPLEIRFQELDQQPLIFAIQLGISN